ncbi:MAG: hypothetical protein LIR40_04580 [Bacteroidota bacterium]|nr:hypothetical protein [Bacteroidota bacterium]
MIDQGNLFDFEDFFKDKKDYISWKNGGYKIYFNVKRFFCNPTSKKEINLLDQVELLINSSPGDPSGSLIEKCRHFIQLHRIVENTNARKRLERWAKRVIVVYLFVVFILVVFDSNNIHKAIEISDAVMITILSTTTVNIIGLGLIILRGHFYTKEEGVSINRIKGKQECSTDTTIDNREQ